MESVRPSHLKIAAHLLLLLLLAKIVSDAVVRTIGISLETTSIELPKPKIPPVRGVEPLSRSEFDVILRRNLFNPEGTIPEELGPLEGTSLLDAEGAASTTLPITLVGTIILTNPLKSLAAIRDTGLNKTESYRVGENLLGKAKIAKIERKKVYFQNQDSGNLEYVEIKEEALPERIGMVGAPREGIKKISEDNFVVDKGFVDTTLENINQVITQARAVPNFVDGKVNGFKLFAIKPGSIYEQLGLQNGDIVLKVNGIALDSPAKALELYGDLQNLTELTIDYEREGSRRTTRYTVR